MRFDWMVNEAMRRLLKAQDNIAFCCKSLPVQSVARTQVTAWKAWNTTAWSISS